MNIFDVYENLSMQLEPCDHLDGNQDGSRSELVNYIISFCEFEEVDKLTVNRLERVIIKEGKGHLSAKSIKLQNTKYNLVQMFESVASGVFTVSSIVSQPWLAPFGFLLLWRSIIGAITVQIEIEDALVLMGLFSLSNSGSVTNIENIVKEVHQLFMRYKVISPSIIEVKTYLHKLQRLGCIEFSKSTETWNLVEKLAFQ